MGMRLIFDGVTTVSEEGLFVEAVECKRRAVNLGSIIQHRSLSLGFSWHSQGHIGMEFIAGHSNAGASGLDRASSSLDKA